MEVSLQLCFTSLRNCRWNSDVLNSQTTDSDVNRLQHYRLPFTLRAVGPLFGLLLPTLREKYSYCFLFLFNCCRYGFVIATVCQLRQNLYRTKCLGSGFCILVAFQFFLVDRVGTRFCLV